MYKTKLYNNCFSFDRFDWFKKYSWGSWAQNLGWFRWWAKSFKPVQMRVMLVRLVTLTNLVENTWESLTLWLKINVVRWERETAGRIVVRREGLCGERALFRRKKVLTLAKLFRTPVQWDVSFMVRWRSDFGPTVFG